MRREDCRMNMRVIFGRQRGKKTLGEVVKLNLKKAKVKILEGRGSRSQAGQVWGVPYEMMEPADPSVVPADSRAKETAFQAGRADEPIEYSRFQDAAERHILEAMLDCYCGLSPENLSCDGEASPAHVRRVGAELRSRLNHLQKAFGRPVSELVVYAWAEQKRQAERKQEAC